ncbi:MAG: hypothetical protein ACRD0V_12745 [Acidimicrobiales bacterium]
MIRSRGLVALAAVAALSLSACTSNDADAGDVVDAMTDAGLAEGTDPNFPECMGEEFERAFNQDEMNDLAAAGRGEYPGDFPDDTVATVDSIIEDCKDGSASGAEGSQSGGQDGGSETTTTTAAEGN